jgi:hypothetical protein
MLDARRLRSGQASIDFLKRDCIEAGREFAPKLFDGVVTIVDGASSCQLRFLPDDTPREDDYRERRQQNSDREK